MYERLEIAYLFETSRDPRKDMQNVHDTAIDLFSEFLELWNFKKDVSKDKIVDIFIEKEFMKDLNDELPFIKELFMKRYLRKTKDHLKELI